MIRLISFLLCISFLNAEEDSPQYTPSLSSHSSFPIANIEGEPNAIVAGCVNVITGDYFDVQCDLVMVGGEPLVLERSYSSSDDSKGSLSNGWHFNMQGCLFCNKNGNDYVLKSSFGSEIDFDNDSSKLHSRMFKKGFTNNSSGIISGKTNLKNYKLFSELEATRTYRVTKGDGSYCLFKRKQRKSKFREKRFWLEVEHKSSGIEQLHHYDDKNRLSKIEIKNKANDKLQSFTFDYPSKSANKTHLTVFTNDGRNVQYSFINNKFKDERTSYLTEVIRPNGPTEIYRYEGDLYMRVNEKIRPDHRVLSINYYKTGKYGEFYVSQTDINFGRVQCLLAPIGVDATLLVSHSFEWIQEANSQAGECRVFDAKHNMTLYRWDDNLRLTSIAKMLNENDIYTEDKLYWGKGKNEGNLVSRVFRSANDAFFCKTYDYDDFGNVITERLYGHQTGKNPVALVIDEEGRPIETGCDRYEKHYVYSQDGRNLLLDETDGSKSFSYRYYPDSDLVAMKYVMANGIIRQRHCYTYDENCALQTEIIDDGFSDDPPNLAGVTYRKIRRMTPRKTFPIGLPETIEEYYQDPTTQAEHLEKALVNSYSIEGRLTRQDCYDANREFRYSLFWEYNAMGNVTLESNAIGQVIIRRYDANGNKIYECGPNPEYHKNFQYDFSNRLTCIEEVHANRTLSTHYTYDYLGNKTSSIDHYGNETNYVYDSFGRLKHTVAPSQFEGIRPITNISYDYLGNKAAVQDPKGNTTITYYTVKGKPNHILHADGTQEHFTYYINGTLEAHLDRNRCLTKYYYDYLDRPTRTEFYSPEGVLKWTTSATYDAFHLLSETDAMGNVTNYTYDVFGRKKSTSCNDSLETYDYDALGRLAKKIVFYGYEPHEAIVYSYEYDLLDQIIQERTEDVFGNVILQRNKIYDCEGRVIFDTTYNENAPTPLQPTMILMEPQLKSSMPLAM